MIIRKLRGLGGFKFEVRQVARWTTMPNSKTVNSNFSDLKPSP